MTFFVPTGACGHVAAAGLAVLCGLPINVVASNNANGALSAFLDPEQGGQLVPPPAIMTNSPAMDISIPYNFERLLSLAGADGSCVRQVMDELKMKRKSTILPSLVEAVRSRLHLSAVRASDEDVIQAMATCAKNGDRLFYFYY